MDKIIPRRIVELKKRLDTIEKKSDGRIQLKFTDGTWAEADFVIRTDGIKSRVRELMFGLDNPISFPHYTHQIAYRALIPMTKAIQALGEYIARNQHNHVEPNANLIYYLVENQTMINTTAFVFDPNEWPDDKVIVVPGLRTDLEKAFAQWNPCFTALIQHFPEKLEKWAVFDTCDYPAPHFNQGVIYLTGDAAHASSPHHGASACCGIEDALCLCTLIDQVNCSLRGNSAITKEEALCAAFIVFDATRRTRGQWLVNSSRRVCDLYHQPEWSDEKKWIKAETCFEEIKDRSLKISHFDYDAMMKTAVQEYAKMLPAKV